MGIISNGRCCGRNIVFDVVTGLNPAPTSPYPCYYRSQLFDEPLSGSGAALITPLDTFPAFQNFSDMQPIKDVYKSLAMFSQTFPSGSAQFYWYIMDVDGTLDLESWTIDWGTAGAEPIVWEQLSCGGEFTEGCYSVDFNVDIITNPLAAINYINNMYVQDIYGMFLDPVGNGITWADVNNTLTQILRMMFIGSTLDATITDNGGGSFTLSITGMGSFPTAPPTIGIAYDYTLPSEDQTLNLTPFTCP